MITLRLSEARGQANHGWLQTRHTFSFANYYHPDFMGFGPLVVINEDHIAPGTGFGMHGHRDMEILTYVLDGAIAHRDSMGNGSVIRPGNVQRMSAGRGIRHSEFNPLPDQTTHLLQFWIEPDVHGIEPEYEELELDDASRRGRLRCVASPDGAEGAMRIHQDAALYIGRFDGAESAEHALAPGRRAWVHIARGRLAVNGHMLKAGDAAAVTDEPRIVLDQGEGAEVLLFDLA